MAKTLRTLILDQKRETFVDECVSQARKLQTSGDLAAALSRVEEGLSSYPREMRLMQIRDAVQRDLQTQRRQTRRRDLEELRRLESEADSAIRCRHEAVRSARKRGRWRTSISKTKKLLSSANGLLQKLNLPAVTGQGHRPGFDFRRDALVCGDPADRVEPPDAAKAAASQPSASCLRRQPQSPARRRDPPDPAIPASASAKPVGTRSRSERDDCIRSTPNQNVLDRVPSQRLYVLRRSLAASYGRHKRPLSLRLPQIVSSNPHCQSRQPAARSACDEIVVRHRRWQSDIRRPAARRSAGCAVDARQNSFRRSHREVRESCGKCFGMALTSAAWRVARDQDTNHRQRSSRGGRKQHGRSPSRLFERCRSQVSLDGQPPVDVPVDGVDFSSVAAGTHELTVSRGSEQYKLTIEVAAAPALSAFVESGQNVGTLVVVTGQDKSRVFLNGKALPQETQGGQLRIANLEPKEYVVRVTKPGYQDAPDQKIRIRKGEQGRLVFGLLPVPHLASLSIQGGTPGATVLIDQANAGTVQPDGTLTLSSILPGDHVIELRKDRFKTKQIKKHFVVGTPVVLAASDATLDAAPGELKITFTLADAQVTLTKAGESPVKVSSGSSDQSARRHLHPDRTHVRQFRALYLRWNSPPVSRVLSTCALAPSGMSKWDDPSGWKQENGAFVRKGGDYVLYGVTPTSGTFIFSAMLTKGHRLQWVVNYTDSEQLRSVSDRRQQFLPDRRPKRPENERRENSSQGREEELSHPADSRVSHRNRPPDQSRGMHGSFSIVGRCPEPISPPAGSVFTCPAEIRCRSRVSATIST